ncbi:AP2/ERF family transcription factor [Candidatus Pacearchaeota archaeon]|nr:AP2/ERF family transcription factor [Candidatus Pacearchaeota archaeon]
MAEKQIELSRGLVAVVDEADFEELSKFSWYASESRGKFYAARRGRATEYEKGEKRPMIYMHREIMKASPGVLVDHRNGDSLLNCRFNLRRSCHQTNTWNTRCSGGSSKYKGVSKDKKGRIRARIQCDGKPISLGSHKSEEEAARAYDKKAFKLFEEFAVLNFPEEHLLLDHMIPF